MIRISRVERYPGTREEAHDSGEVLETREIERSSLVSS